MQQNVCNAAKDEMIEVGCGGVRAVVNARTEGEAFRKAMRAMKKTKEDWGEIARFRVVRIGHGKRKYIQSPWFYQEPFALMQTK